MKFTNGRLLRQKAHRIIPGGCHTYAKGDDQYPDQAPSFIDRGKGCHVWDTDGNEFIEYGMGLRAVTLGHAFESVVSAAHKQMQLGNNFTRPAKIEVDYAEELTAAIPCGDMVKFAKDGSTVTTAAIKLARAYTGKDKIAYCEDQPFFSYNDWFIGTTPIRGGIPADGAAHSLGFRYNDIQSLQTLFDNHPDEVACVIMEPEKEQPPQNNFLGDVRDLCSKNGALLIFDEMITGFRWAIGGAQEVYEIEPDLATFGKGLANGFSLSALAGRRDIMELGGIYHDKDRVFLLSTTHGAENHAIAAARETLRIYQEEDVIGQLHRQGKRLIDGAREITSSLDMEDRFHVFGRPCSLVYVTLGDDGQPSQLHRTLFLQEMIKNGIIAPSFVISFSHTDKDVDDTLDAIEKSLIVLKKAISDDPRNYIVGNEIKSVYRNRN